ncbi:unnamed protein product [Caenorhabditis angaria]|uniref:Uncharacterized protein n=1 Tax=Caenorhabditis angaria TaxID=860376 RepID=A0A9P1IYS8_9PELO|nr:unnamed protein product [Caenorhabditis angaria]
MIVKERTKQIKSSFRCSYKNRIKALLHIFYLKRWLNSLLSSFFSSQLFLDFLKISKPAPVIRIVDPISANYASFLLRKMGQHFARFLPKENNFLPILLACFILLIVGMPMRGDECSSNSDCPEGERCFWMAGEYKGYCVLKKT